MEQRYVPVLAFPRKQCCGSKKWRWSIQWAILSHRDQFENIISLIFEVLDAKIASFLKKIIQNSYFKKKVNLVEQKAQLKDRFLRGRQIAFMIYEFFRAHGAVLGYSDLVRVAFHGDDVHVFDTTWDEVLLSISQVPSDDILEGLYKMRIGESDQLETELAMD